MEMEKYEYQVRTGLNVLITEKLEIIKGKKVGLVTNHTGVDRSGKPNFEILMKLSDVDLKAIFAPEHGFYGNVSRGQIVDDQEQDGLPVIYSLYGNTRKPTLEMLDGLDLIIYDIQDIGARFYTYISTLGLVMEAAAEAGIPVIVLDRPNPLGGLKIEGPVLDLKYSSFVGMYPIPIRYGLTIGELAKMIVGEKWIKSIPELYVVRMQNWRRKMTFDETGLPWIKPSPNIPDLETAIIYPGMCLLEATNMSEGRGTFQPFKKIGSPWYYDEITMDMNGMKLSGVTFKKIKFTPKSIKGMSENPKYLNQKCVGLKTIILDQSNYNSVETGIKFLYIAQIMTARSFSVNSKSMNRLWGNNQLTRLLQGKGNLNKILKEINRDEALFRTQRNPYLLYD
jgi:uncharacterized protein YbbC (DUF1343 family)